MREEGGQAGTVQDPLWLIGRQWGQGQEGRSSSPGARPSSLSILTGYSICRNPARPWRDPPGRLEPPWKPAWFKATYGVGELFPEGPQEVTEVKMGTCLDWSQVGG